MASNKWWIWKKKKIPKSKSNKKRKKYFSAEERSAFRIGLLGLKEEEVYLPSEKERNSFRRGKEIGSSKDYQVADMYTRHMNRKFGIFDKEDNHICDDMGRPLGLNHKPLPSTYENYIEMKKKPTLKKELYENYDYETIIKNRNKR